MLFENWMSYLQRPALWAAVNGEERCATKEITAAQEITTPDKMFGTPRPLGYPFPLPKLKELKVLIFLPPPFYFPPVHRLPSRHLLRPIPHPPPPNAGPVGMAGDHFLSHLERVKYMHWSAELPRKVYCWWIEGVKICIFVPVCYNSFNASQVHEFKKNYPRGLA